MFGNERSDEDASIPGNKERFVAGKREVERGSTRVRSYVTDMPAHEQARHRTGADRNDNSSMHNDAGTDVGNTAAGLGKEAMGNIKQGLGSLTGDEDLKRSGEEQERSGEAQRGTTPDRSY